MPQHLSRGQQTFAVHHAAKVLSRMYDLKMARGNPAIDLERRILYLPPIPPISSDKEAVDLRAELRCWVAHECGGHGRHTEPSILSRYQRELQSQPLLHGLFMAIEDPRIELAYMGEFRGGQLVLDQGLKVEIEHDKIRRGDQGPGDALQCYVHYWGRVHWQGQRFLEDHGYLAGAHAHLSAYLDPKDLDRLDALLEARFRAVSSSQEAMDLAEEILALLESIADEQDDPPGSDGDDGDTDDDTSWGAAGRGVSGGDRDDDDPDGGNASGPASSDTADGASGEDGSDGGANSSLADGSGHEGEGADASSPASASGSSASASNDAQGSARSGSARDILDDGTSVDGESPVDHGSGFASDLTESIEANRSSGSRGPPGAPALGDDGEATTPDGDAASYQRVRESIEGTVSSLRRRVLSIVQARTQERRRSSTSGKRLKPGTAARLVQGDPRLFVRKRTVVAPDTAVMFLGDLSGSMDDRQRQMLQQVFTCLGDVVAGVQQPLEMLGFGAGNRHPAGLAVFKRFEELFRTAKGRVGALRSVDSGGTPMGAALMEAGHRFADRDEPRKLLFVLTDGAPDEPVEEIRRIVAALEACGVEVVGIGLDFKVDHLFKKAAFVHDIAELGSAVMTTLLNNLK